MSDAGPVVACVAAVRLVALHPRGRAHLVHCRMGRAKPQCGQLQHYHLDRRLSYSASHNGLHQLQTHSYCKYNQTCLHVLVNNFHISR